MNFQRLNFFEKLIIVAGSTTILLFFGISAAVFLLIQYINWMEPSETEMLVMAEQFIDELEVDISSADHFVNLLTWPEDVHVDSHIVSTYTYSESQFAVEAKLRKRLTEENGWIIAEVGERWYGNEIEGLHFFCALSLNSDGTYRSGPFDSSVTLTEQDELVIWLNDDNANRCNLNNEQ